MQEGKGRGILRSFIMGFGIMFKAETKMMLLYSCFAIIHAISQVLIVIFTQRFFDVCEEVVNSNGNISKAYQHLLGMILAYALSQLMNGLHNGYSQILYTAMEKHTNNMIFNKIHDLNVIEFEDTRRLSYINKAINGSHNLFWVCLTLSDAVFFYTTYFILFGWYLFTLKPILSVAIILVFIPCMLSNFIRTLQFKKLEDQSAPIRREYEHYEQCITDKEYFKETRLLGIYSFLDELYTKALVKLNKLVFFTQLRKHILNFMLKLLTIIGYGNIIYIIFTLVMNREISIGAFAAILWSVNSVFNFMNEVISERFGWASENLGTVQNFLDFINQDVNQSKEELCVNNFNIKLKNVSFQYPSTDRSVVKNVNLEIKDGETLAIVGTNGSGKTTLCRIIMGLFEPSDGEVLYGYKPAKQLFLDNLSAVFQNYQRYQMVLKDNIQISQMEKDTDENQIYEICAKASVDLENEMYRNGLNTMLGRDFNGVDLSGGQWQRVAIARGLYRENHMIVLDEPTAAIDPLKETELYNDFIEICRDKTAIIVTHRLALAKTADRIIVMKDGKIVQNGMHSELINMDGDYKMMYEEQRIWYMNKEGIL